MPLLLFPTLAMAGERVYDANALQKGRRQFETILTLNKTKECILKRVQKVR